jgi:lipoprotein NlpD
VSALLARQILVLLAVAVLAAGCTARRPAPVSERAPQPSVTPPRIAVTPPPPPAASAAAPQAGREHHIVKAGDTLYSIALENGLDYRELAAWNGLESPGVIRIGQSLRLTPPPGAVATPFKTPGSTVEARPLGPAAPGTPPVAGRTDNIKTAPKGVRVPYSDQAYAQLSKTEVAVAPAPAPKAESAKNPDEPEWGWPAAGKIIGTYNGNTIKGIDIAGKAGQAVYASAGGRVIFSGTGIRGLGKFIVIKHNDAFISVYAHNQEVLVKYDQSVTKGQKIAEMGSTDSEQVKLHFEIRRFGTPVDPQKLLPDPPG